LHTQQAADAAKIFHPSYATDHVKRQRAEAKRLAREQEEKQRKKEEAEREDAAEKEGNQKRDEYARRIKEFPEGIIQIILEEFDEIRNRYKPTKFIKYFPELMNSIEYKIKDYEERLEAKKKEVERQEAKRLKRERKEAKKAKKIEEVKQEVKKYREYFERQVRELRDKDRQTILEKFDKRSSKIKTMHELLHLNNEIMADIKSLPPPPKPTRRPMPTPQPQVEKRWRKA
jgi:type I site-specific restriction-modification system R (restriction) subunit